MYHDDISLEYAKARYGSEPLPPEPAGATLALKYEPSGEIRISMRIPKKAPYPAHDNEPPSHFITDGPGSLVCSEKLREPDGARSGRGILPADKRFTVQARRFVKSAVAVLGELFQNKIAFLTITLPGGTSQAMRGVAVWSATIVDDLQHWVKYNCPGSLMVSVWELQKRGALHLHAAIGSDCAEDLAEIEERIKSYAYKLFQNISALSGVDMFQRANGETWAGSPDVIRASSEFVRKDVRRYMSKYVSKGAGEAVGCSPSAWWGASQELRRLVHAKRSCILSRILDWDLAERLMRQLVAIAGQRASKVFSYQEPYAPHNVTTIIYPQDGQDTLSYNELTQALRVLTQRAYHRG